MSYSISTTGRMLHFDTSRPTQSELAEACQAAGARSLANRLNCQVSGLSSSTNGYIEAHFTNVTWPAPSDAELYKTDEGYYRIVVSNRPSPFATLALPGICRNYGIYALAIAPTYWAQTASLCKLFFNIPTGGLIWRSSVNSNRVIARQFGAVNLYDESIRTFLRATPAPPVIPYDAKSHLVTIFGESLATKIGNEIKLV